MQKPTLEQGIQFFSTISHLTAIGQPINFVQMDDRTQNLIFIAGQVIEVYIQPLGEVRVNITGDDFDAKDRAYILANREDIEAFHSFCDRLYAQPGTVITSNEELEQLINDRLQG
jgi:hypothetical protein